MRLVVASFSLDFGLILSNLLCFSSGLMCCLNAVRVEAGQALGLAKDSHASVTTFLLISAGEEKVHL